MSYRDNFHQQGSYIGIGLERTYLDTASPPAAGADIQIIDEVAEEPTIPDTIRESENKWAMGGGRTAHRILEKGYQKGEGVLPTVVQSGIFANVTLGTEQLAASYQELAITGTQTLTTATALAAQVYNYKLLAAGPDIPITATALMTYGELLVVLNASVSSDFKWAFYEGSLRCYKATTTDIDLTDGGAAGLFAGLVATPGAAVACTAITLGSTIPTFCAHYHLQNQATSGQDLIRDGFGCLSSKWGMSFELEADGKQDLEFNVSKSQAAADIAQPSLNSQRVFTWSDVKSLIISNETIAVDLKDLSDSWNFEMTNDVDVLKSQGSLWAKRDYLGTFQGNLKLNFEPNYNLMLEVGELELYNALFNRADNDYYSAQIILEIDTDEFIHITVDQLDIIGMPIAMPLIDNETKGVLMSEIEFNFGDNVNPMCFFGSAIVTTIPNLPV